MSQSDGVVYGTSRVRDGWRQGQRGWGWYGWVRWPLSSSGTHTPGHRWPFRWMAKLEAKHLASQCGGGVPATPEQARAQDVGGCDPERWF